MTQVARIMMAVALLGAAGGALADEHGKPMAAQSAWSRELPPVSENGAAYVTIMNRGTEAPFGLVCEFHAERRRRRDHRIQRRPIKVGLDDAAQMDRSGDQETLFGADINDRIPNLGWKDGPASMD